MLGQIEHFTAFDSKVFESNALSRLLAHWIRILWSLWLNLDRLSVTTRKFEMAIHKRSGY